MRKVLLFILSVMLFSCNKENDISFKSEFISVESSNPIPIISNFRELYEVSGIKYEELSQQYSEKIATIGLQKQTATGYTRIAESRHMITMFDPAFADSIGLEPYTTYVYNWLFVEKDINTNGARFYQAKTSKKCGMVPVMSYDQTEITDFLNRGYRVLETGNPTVLRTHIFFVLSLLNGAQLNKYVPRSPEDLEWNYNLYNLKNENILQ